MNPRISNLRRTICQSQFTENFFAHESSFHLFLQCVHLPDIPHIFFQFFFQLHEILQFHFHRTPCEPISHTSDCVRHTQHCQHSHPPGYRHLCPNLYLWYPERPPKSICCHLLLTQCL